MGDFVTRDQPAYNPPNAFDPNMWGGALGINQKPNDGSWIDNNKSLIGGGLLSLTGILGASSTLGGYDPERNALARFKELTNPNSNFYLRTRALYTKLASDSAPSMSGLLSLAKTSGIGTGSATTLASQQGKEVANRNTENVTNAVNKLYLDNEQIAQRYLAMDEQSQADKQENQGGLFNQILGIGGSLLGKALL